MRRIICLVLVALMVSGCGDKLRLKEVGFHRLPGWESDNHAEALASFERSCVKMKKAPAGKTVHSSGVGGSYGRWQQLCDRAATEGAANPKAFFETYFQPYLAKNWFETKGTFTGYFEAELKGSREQYGPYQYPLYRKPEELEKGKPYLSREEIENGGLAGRGLELVWVDDPIKAFFLQIQGSGRVTLEDGTVMRVGYDGQNGHKYVPIGRYMREEGYLEEGNVSAQTIKAWLYAHPEEMQRVMNENPSFVFFREVTEEGPIGAQGVALTPLRSLAVDKKFIPYGAPVWVDVVVNGKPAEDNSLKRLLIAQDTGGAIRGPVRGDVFFGYGEEAEHLAGLQNSKGQYYVLLPKKL